MLLAGIVDHVLSDGISDLSLRPLGRAVGLSPRALLYHFGSKDALVLAIIEEARKRQRGLLESWLRRSAEYDVGTLLLGAWRWLSAPRNDRFFRLFFETYGVGIQHRRRYGAFLKGAADDWIEFFHKLLVTGGVENDRAANLATILVAVTRGLLLDLLATGDRARCDRAFRSFVTAIELP
ncbi:MAG: TetR/AcrR family transcriptional regulator [Candidatus Eremiobacteraeota bacterium]|nr:TetR/AcrR family transcriptional regulator [Candidatus Eremiobacteraeota bacterium]